MDLIRREARRIVGLDEPTAVQDSPGWSPMLSFRRPLEEPAMPSYGTLEASSSPGASDAVHLVESVHTANSPASFTLDQPLEHTGQVSTSSFKLINFFRDGGARAIVTHRQLFFKVFNTFSLDEYALYLYLTDTPGLHVLGNIPTPSSGSPGTTTLGFYLNNPDFSIVWSYNPVTNATRAITIVKYAVKAGMLFRSILSNHGSRVIFNPVFLAFISSSHCFLNRWEDHEGIAEVLVDKDLNKQDINLLDIETMEVDPRSADLLDNLSRRCVREGGIISHSNEYLRILRLSLDVAKHLEKIRPRSGPWSSSHKVSLATAKRESPRIKSRRPHPS